MDEIKVKVGDIVIRKDGLKGKVIETDNEDYNKVFVEWENGSKKRLTEVPLLDYYLIGHTVLGNKATEEELESAIKCLDYQIEQLKKEKAQLRKQLWRLKEEMVEDWRERKALRELRKLNKENQPTEENTED